MYFKLIRAEKKESLDEQTWEDWEEYFEGKRFRNTNCPFQIMFKVLKDNVSTF